MKKQLINLGIRVAKTMAQTALGVIGSSVMLSDVSWPVVASSVALSGICCILMNVSMIKEIEEE